MIKQVLILLFIVSIPLNSYGKSKINLPKHHYKLGEGYFLKKQYKEALSEFTKAYNLSGKSKLLYNIAFCYEKMKQIGKAIIYYKKYLEKHPDEKLEINKKIKELDLIIKNTHISINGGIVGAKLFLNGNYLGLLPYTKMIRVEPWKPVQIIIKSKNYHDFVTSLVVTPGTTVPLTVVLTPVKKNIKKKLIKQNLIVFKKPKKLLNNNVELKTELKSELKDNYPYKIIGTLVIFSVISFSLSGVTGYLSYDELNKMKTNKDAGNFNLAETNEENSLKYAKIADIGLISGVVFAVSSIITHYIFKNKKERKINIKPGLNKNGLGLFIEGKF
jgi:tetratricopeptide (TPR) repeat protein